MDDESIRKTERRKRQNSITNIGEIILSVVEIAIGIICLGLLRNYHLFLSKNSKSRLFLGIITTGGFILVSTACLLGLFVRKENAPLQMTLVTILGTILYIATGSTSIDFYQRFWSVEESTRIGLVFGALCIVNGFVYLVHAILTFHRHTQRKKPRKLDEDF